MPVIKYPSQQGGPKCKKHKWQKYFHFDMPCNGNAVEGFHEDLKVATNQYNKTYCTTYDKNKTERKIKLDSMQTKKAKDIYHIAFEAPEICHDQVKQSFELMLYSELEM